MLNRIVLKPKALSSRSPLRPIKVHQKKRPTMGYMEDAVSCTYCSSTKHSYYICPSRLWCSNCSFLGHMTGHCSERSSAKFWWKPVHPSIYHDNLKAPNRRAPTLEATNPRDDRSKNKGNSHQNSKSKRKRHSKGNRHRCTNWKKSVERKIRNNQHVLLV